MIKQFTQSVAYICPVCAAVTGRELNIFGFSGKNGIELSCGIGTCKEKAAFMYEAQDKYKISVECPFCGYDHEFQIKKSAFWSKEYLDFKCPASDMSLFFIGDSGKIREEVKKQEKILSEMSKEFEAETGISVMFDIVSLINDMFEDGAVLCDVCGSRDISMDIEEDGIILTCQSCKASLSVGISEEEYQKIARTDILKITK